MVYLIGGAGAPNYGDELILDMWLRTIRRLRPNEEIAVDGGWTGSAGTSWRQLPEGAYWRDGFRSIGERSNDCDFWANFVRGRRFPYLRRREHRTADWLLLNRMSEATILHLHGGGYFYGKVNPRSAFLLGVTTALGEQRGLRLVGTGLGLHPLPPVPEEILSELQRALGVFEILECRDWHSAAALHRIMGNKKVRFGLDDSYLETPKRLATPNTMRLHLAMSYSQLGHSPDLIIDAIADRAKDFDEVVFWECTNKDAGLVEPIVRKRLPALKSLDVYSLLKDGAPVQAGDQMIAFRFHPHLIAARLGAGGCYLAKSAYYRAKHRSAIRVGSPFVAMEKDFIPPFADAATSRILDTETKRVARKRQLAEHIYMSNTGKAMGYRTISERAAGAIDKGWCRWKTAT